MEGADADLVQRLLDKVREPNVVKAVLEVENLETRNAERRVRTEIDVRIPEGTNNWSIPTKACMHHHMSRMNCKDIRKIIFYSEKGL